MSTSPGQPHVSEATRDNLAYLWSAAIIIFVGYIIVRWGQEKEILTLIIGFITGVASTILALYFGGVLGKNTTGAGLQNVDLTLSASSDTPAVDEKNKAEK